MTELAPIYKELVEHFGGQEHTAAALGVKQPSVSGWVNGQKKMSWKTAMRAEIATEGKFKASNLCPALQEFEEVN